MNSIFSRRWGWALVGVVAVLCLAIAAVPAADNAGLRLEAAQSGPADIRMDFTVSAEPGVEQTARGALFNLSGLPSVGRPGEPRLPRRSLRFLLPRDVDLATVRAVVEDGEWMPLDPLKEIAPGLPPASGSGPDGGVSWGNKDIEDIDRGRDMTIYGRDAAYPATPVTNMRCSTYRQWRMVEVEFCPLRWNPATGEASLLREGALRVVFKRLGSGAPTPLAAPADKLEQRWQRIAPSLENPGARGDYYPGEQAASLDADGDPAAGAVTADYVIITTSWIQTNSTALSSFVSHKQGKGYNVSVITEHISTADDTHYVSGMNASARCANIRSWLQNNYNPNIDWVLLIGDPDPAPATFYSNYSIPMMMCWPNPSDHSSYGVPTDLCYAELSGNWDVDGDGFPGEFGSASQDFATGGIDSTPELYVGRIPYYGAGSVTDLDYILTKIVNYESSTASTAWRNKLLIPSAVSNFEDDNSPYGNFPTTNEDTWPRTLGDGYGEAIKTLATGYSFSAYTLYEKTGCKTDGTAYPLTACNATLTQPNVQSEWLNSYGFVSWWGHGSQTGVARKIWANDAFMVDNLCQIGQEDSWTPFWSASNCTALNDSYPSFVFQSSCSNGHPENSGNLGYSLLRQGAVATLSSSRISWYAVGTWQASNGPVMSDNVSFCYESFNRMVGSGDTVGEALNYCRSNFGFFWSQYHSWANHLDFNLYGSPDSSHLDTGASGPNPPTSPGQDTASLSISNIRWTWGAAATPPAITGYKVYCDPGAGPPTTLATTVGSGQTYYDMNVSSVNAPYCMQVCSTDGSNDSAKTGNIVRHSGIEPVATVNFSNITIDSISVGCDSTPGGFTGLATGSSGLQYTNVTAGGMKSPWLQTMTPFQFGPGMLANTQYSFDAQSRNADGVGSPIHTGAAAYTAIEPVSGLVFGAVADTSVVVDVAAPAFSNIVLGQSGIRFANTTAGTNSGWSAGPWAPWQSSGLTPNTLYTFTGTSRNGDALETTPASANVRTLAALPGIPTLANPSTDTLELTLGSGDGNPAGTNYAVYCLTTAQYLQADGSMGPHEDWQTAGVWTACLCTGLAPDTTYEFQVKAKNDDDIETLLGSSGSGTTLDDGGGGEDARGRREWRLYE